MLISDNIFSKNIFVYNAVFSELDLKKLLKKTKNNLPTNPYEGQVRTVYKLNIIVKNLNSKEEYQIEIDRSNKNLMETNLPNGTYQILKLKILLFGKGSVDETNVDFKFAEGDVYNKSRLPNFTLRNNCALLYGQINLKDGNVRFIKNKTVVANLKKYAISLKKRAKWKNIKIVQ